MIHSRTNEKEEWRDMSKGPIVNRRQEGTLNRSFGPFDSKGKLCPCVCDLPDPGPRAPLLSHALWSYCGVVPLPPPSLFPTWKSKNLKVNGQDSLFQLEKSRILVPQNIPMALFTFSHKCTMILGSVSQVLLSCLYKIHDWNNPLVRALLDHLTWQMWSLPRKRTLGCATLAIMAEKSVTWPIFWAIGTY